MKSKKQRMFEKYLEKRNKLRNRDDLYAQLQSLTEGQKSVDYETLQRQERKLKQREKKKKLKELRSKTHDDTEEKDTCDNSCDSRPHTSTNPICDKKKDVSNFKQGEVDENFEIAENTTLPANEARNSNDEFDIEYNGVKEESDLKSVLTLNHVEHKARDPNIEKERMALPAYYKKSEVIESIRYSPITFIQGATGCGKSTQIPQFLYEAGFFESGIIGITQPRRISAISISNRINVELNEKISGYKIKNDSTVTSRTKIKVMTHGILLKEIQEDFLLSKYSVIILDEIHERSINIDILIALIDKIIKTRETPLRLVLMSATSSVDDFLKYFGAFNLIDIEANAHKINIFYGEQIKDYMHRYIDLAFEKVRKIIINENTKESGSKNPFRNIPSSVVNDKNSAILVFLTSKQDIYYMKSLIELANLDVIVIPLHSSLSESEQALIYEKSSKRKIILSTNVAETGLTIPDVVFVVDSGLVKQKVTDDRGIVSYKKAFISKSNAQQRAGRAGRTGPGVCFRLYTGTMYDKFEENNLPQMLVEPLDEVVLSLLNLGIPDISSFPFLVSPPISSIEKSFKTLEALGAISGGKVTDMGCKMAAYPLSPRLSRLLCIGDTFYEMIVLMGLISSSFEIKKNLMNGRYFDGARSDYIVALRLVNDFMVSNDKYRFCKDNDIRYSTVIDALKTAKQLAEMSGKSGNIPNLDLSGEKCRRICEIMYCGFADHMAISNGDSMFFEQDEVYLSNDSIDVDGENLVFEYLVASKNKLYMKNITIIDKKFY